MLLAPVLTCCSLQRAPVLQLCNNLMPCMLCCAQVPALGRVHDSKRGTMGESTGTSLHYLTRCRKARLAVGPLGRSVQRPVIGQHSHLQHIVANGLELVHMTRHKLLRSLKLLI